TSPGAIWAATGRAEATSNCTSATSEAGISRGCLHTLLTSGSTTTPGSAALSHRHPARVQKCSQRVEEAWPLTLDPSPRAIVICDLRSRERSAAVSETNRSAGSSKAPGVCGVLRLVEDDTAALRSPLQAQWPEGRVRRRI